MKKVLKVGFDLDGVVLYNPIRFVRPIAKIFKPLKSQLLKQDRSSFYFPKSTLEKTLFRLLHLTSFRADNGLKNLQKLVDDKKIEAYLVTGRYSFLKNDFQNWMKKIHAEKMFTAYLQNEKDLQPNDFKEMMIKKLKLDIYIEDNFDIIQKLNHHTSAKIFWITNFLDRGIDYQYKFNSLKEALEYLEKIK